MICVLTHSRLKGSFNQKTNHLNIMNDDVDQNCRNNCVNNTKANNKFMN